VSKDWKTCQFPDVVFIQEGPGIRKYEYEEGGYPMINVRCVQDGYIDMSKSKAANEKLATGKWKHFQIQPGDILFTISGTIGRSAIVLEGDLPLLMNTSVVRFRPTTDELTTRFLYYSVRTKSFIDKLKSDSTGTAIKNVGPTHIRRLEISYPLRPEQERIVAILDEAFEAIDTAIANTEKNLENARELFDSTVPQYVYAKSLMADARSTDVASVALPVKGSIRTGPFGSQLLKRELVKTGIPVLGIDNVVHNEFRWGKARFINEEKYKQLSRYTVKPGDVLITIMGTCGRCAVVPDDIPLAINTKHLCCISLDQSECLPEYLRSYFLHHPTARDFLVERAKGSIMDGLNMGIIKELPLLLPTIEAQEQIVDRLNHLQQQIDGAQRTYKTKIALLGELKQSILQQAFSGEHIVSVEPMLKEAQL